MGVRIRWLVSQLLRRAILLAGNGRGSIGVRADFVALSGYMGIRLDATGVAIPTDRSQPIVDA